MKFDFCCGGILWGCGPGGRAGWGRDKGRDCPGTGSSDSPTARGGGRLGRGTLSPS